MSPVLSRNKNIDALRVLSALCVVFIHAASYAEILPFAIANALTRFSVPVFFMISGYCMLTRDYSLKRMLGKTLRLLLIMLGWSAIYCIISRPENFVKELFLGPVHFWYFYATIILYLLTPIFATFAKNTDKKTYGYVLVVLFIFGCVVNILLMAQVSPTLSEIFQKAKFTPQTGFVFCYLLGGYIKIFSFTEKERYTAIICGLIGMVVSFSAILLLNAYLPEYSNIAISFFSPAVIASAVMIFSVVEHSKYKSKISLLAPYTLGIYILHILVLNYVSQPLLSFIEYKGFVYIISNAILTFTISLFISYVIKKIPILKKTI